MLPIRIDAVVLAFHCHRQQRFTLAPATPSGECQIDVGEFHDSTSGISPEFAQSLGLDGVRVRYCVLGERETYSKQGYQSVIANRPPGHL